ncbi:MAG: hypothetical protein SGILL_007020 [Bacillariaceae sp.]
MTFSVEFDAAMIPHAIRHYHDVLGLRKDQFLVVLHHSQRNAVELQEMVEVLHAQDIRHVHTWSGNFTSQANCNQRWKQRQGIVKDECDWVLKFDADELLRVPNNDMKTFLQFLGIQGFDSLSASWMDRVAAEGKLLNISSTDTAPLEEQFPLACQFSANAGANATTRKVVAFRGYLREKRAGHSLERKSALQTCRYPAQLILDHYKWSWPVVEKLRRRLAHYKQLDSTWWWKESETFLNHIDSNGGRIDVANPEYQCYEDNSRDANRPMIHSLFDIEDGVAESTPCQRQVRQCPNLLI